MDVKTTSCAYWEIVQSGPVNIHRKKENQNWHRNFVKLTLSRLLCISNWYLSLLCIVEFNFVIKLNLYCSSRKISFELWVGSETSELVEKPKKTSLAKNSEWFWRTTGSAWSTAFKVVRQTLDTAWLVICYFWFADILHNLNKWYWKMFSLQP